jgi:methionyl-tRNA synthetase
MQLIHLYGVLSAPFIPATAAAMRAVFATDDAAEPTWVSQEQAAALDFVPAGTSFAVPPVLFAKITDEDLAAWRERFGAQ